MGERLRLLSLFRAEREDPEPFYALLADRTLRDFPFPLDGQRVLDLGAGPGHYSAAMARAGAEVVALEWGVEDVRAARERTGRAMRGDAERIGLRDASVDGVLCSNLLEHTPDWRRVLSEAARVVRPGGWIWLSWTNWYSPWGGHDITPLHLLGPRLGPALHRRFRGEPERNAPFDGLWPTYVADVIEAVEGDDRLHLQAARPRYYPSQQWVTRVPVVREFATWNCLLEIRRVDEPEVEIVEREPAEPGRGVQLRAAGRRRLRRVRQRLGDDPRYLPIVLRATPLGTSRRIGEHTDLVIEGFPRSGNTFAVFAINDANPDLTIASHVHVPAQVELAVRRALPTLVVVREPVGAVASHQIASPHADLGALLREYAHYHRQLQHLVSKVVVADFTTVTSDMDIVIGRLNERFGLELASFDHTPNAVARTFRAIDRHHAATYRRARAERGLPRPVRGRDRARDAIRNELLSDSRRDALAAARAAYEALSAAAAVESAAVESG